MQISFTPEFTSRLREELRQTGRHLHNPHGGCDSYEIERSIDEDMLLVSVGWANSYYANETYAAGEAAYTDEWGIGWKHAPYQTRFGTGYYTEIVSHPLAEDSALDSYEPPDPTRPELYCDAAEVIRRFRDEYWIVGITVTTIFETAWALRGLVRMLTDFVQDPELAGRILDIPFRYHLAAAKRLVRMGVDMIRAGDDVGTQDRMLISPVAWRRLLKPRMAQLVAELKAINPAVRVAYHSDGCIHPIVADLVEIGLDVLNPIQPRSMNPTRLKREYGQRLAFWGTIDEQHTLPFGAPEEVRAEIRERIRTVGAGGGLILSPTHHVQLDTPMENFWAMVDTIRSTRMAAAAGVSGREK